MLSCANGPLLNGQPTWYKMKSLFFPIIPEKDETETGKLQIPVPCVCSAVPALALKHRMLGVLVARGSPHCGKCLLAPSWAPSAVGQGSGSLSSWVEGAASIPCPRGCSPAPTRLSLPAAVSHVSGLPGRLAPFFNFNLEMQFPPQNTIFPVNNISLLRLQQKFPELPGPRRFITW